MKKNAQANNSTLRFVDRNVLTIVIPVTVIMFVASILYAIRQDSARSSSRGGVHSMNEPTTAGEPDLPPVTASGALPEQPRTTRDNLAFLIEEEKLAHDVYTVLGDKWGSRAFDNITGSESTHQSRILALLQARSIPDPRTGKAGTFTNADIQNLYNELIAKGLRSARDAYEVGALIEQTDIADINKMLKTEKDQDVVNALNDLKNGSYNHLRAFNRQAGV